jgi:hypothetical protein
MAKALVRFAPVLAALLVVVGSAQAANEAQIRAAIKAAVGFLKSGSYAMPVEGTGGGNGENYEEGPAALAGIAMMEAGVDPSETVIQSIAKIVREQAVKQHRTYQLALDIIFLDKLGEQVDTTLIQSMGVRLLGGQSQAGGWTYTCPQPDKDEQHRLKTALGGASMKGTKGEQVGLDPSSRPELDAALKGILNNRRAGGVGTGTEDDNSNTQFALLGLWAARRHGVPVGPALTLIDHRMRQMQAPSGGWGYKFSGNEAVTSSMTCAGLLCLAITGGSRGETAMKSAMIGPDGKIRQSTLAEKNRHVPNLLADPQVQKGMAYLGAAISGKGPLGGAGAAAPVIPFPGTGGANPPPVVANPLLDNLYFLWSLERVCAIFGPEGERAIGGNWYQWGASALVSTQNRDGSWKGGGTTYPQVADTSFALMFLCKSNIVKDLSNLLNRKMNTTTAAPKPSTAAGPPAGGPAKDTPLDTNDPAAMAKALASATGARYAELLKQFTDAKGSAFTDALAQAISQLSGESQKGARDALAERMSGMPASVLKKRLRDQNAEIRRASALAVYMGSDEADVRALVPDVIDALSDSDDLVVRGARLALKSLAKDDFGPAPGATAAQKQKAVADWKAWWDKQKK